MTLQQVLQTITNSSNTDWNMISCWGADSGPSYRDRFEFYEVRDGSQDVLTVESHTNVAAFRDDVAITLAWGLEHRKSYNAPFSDRWPDTHVSSFFVDVFYNGALIDREVLISVDGGRAYLPAPNNLGVVKGIAKEIARLVDSMVRRSEFDRYFEESEFIVE